MSLFQDFLDSRDISEINTLRGRTPSGFQVNPTPDSPMKDDKEDNYANALLAKSHKDNRDKVNSLLGHDNGPEYDAAQDSGATLTGPAKKTVGAPNPQMGKIDRPPASGGDLVKLHRLISTFDPKTVLGLVLPGLKSTQVAMMVSTYGKKTAAF